MSSLTFFKILCIVIILCLTATLASAQVFTSLVDFGGPLGFYSFGTLVQGNDGNLYGTLTGVGSDAFGTVFSVTTDGTFIPLYNFTSSDNYPGPLMKASDGNFYGTNALNNSIFEITPQGDLTVLYNFNPGRFSSVNPTGPLLQVPNGTFYGVSAGGKFKKGTVFQMSVQPIGVRVSALYNFTGGDDGANPAAPLIFGSDGNIYGTTTGGGVYHDGTVFKLTPLGALTTLHSFNRTDGRTPNGGLLQASNGNLYGTTVLGGIHNNGTIFQITLSGSFTSLYEFHGADGSRPNGQLIQASDGNLYGTTSGGGNQNCFAPFVPSCGTIFRISPTGAFTSIYQLTPSDGALPYAGLVQAANGILYGTTNASAGFRNGGVFSLSLGLDPVTESK